MPAIARNPPMADPFTGSGLSGHAKERHIERVWLDWIRSLPFGEAIRDTFPNRVNYPPSSFTNRIFVSTDTRIAYISDGTNWIYLFGTLYNTAANKPSSGGATAWSGATAYIEGDLVSRLGVDYYCILAHTNQQPPNATYWYVIPALGLNDVGLRFQASDTTQRWRWSGSAWREDYELTDAGLSNIARLLRLVHLTNNAGSPAAGFGADVSFELHNSAKARKDAAMIGAEWGVSTSTAETSAVWVKLMAAGVAAAKFFEVLITGIRINVGGFFVKLTHAAGADCTATLPPVTSSITYETSALTNNQFVFGGGGALVKDAGFSVVPEANGGTHQSTYTTGDILYASAANTLSKLAASTSGKVLTSGGAGVAPAWSSAVLFGSSPYTPTNVTTDRSYDANATTIDELANVLGTLIVELQAKGVLS